MEIGCDPSVKDRTIVLREQDGVVVKGQMVLALLQFFVSICNVDGCVGYFNGQRRIALSIIVDR